MDQVHNGALLFREPRGQPPLSRHPFSLSAPPGRFLALALSRALGRVPPPVRARGPDQRRGLWPQGLRAPLRRDGAQAKNPFEGEMKAALFSLVRNWLSSPPQNGEFAHAPTRALGHTATSSPPQLLATTQKGSEKKPPSSFPSSFVERPGPNKKSKSWPRDPAPLGPVAGGLPSPFASSPGSCSPALSTWPRPCGA